VELRRDVGVPAPRAPAERRPRGRSTATRASLSRRVASRQDDAGALVDRLLAGKSANELLAARVGDWLFATKVKPILVAARRHDGAAWAKRQQTDWPDDMPFAARHFESWDGSRLRKGLLASAAALVRLVAPLDFASFQVREELTQELLCLAAESDAVQVMTAPEVGAAFSAWKDQGSLLRLGGYLDHAAATSEGRTAENLRALRAIFGKPTSNERARRR
jgi:hypothetical protein